MPTRSPLPCTMGYRARCSKARYAPTAGRLPLASGKPSAPTGTATSSTASTARHCGLGRPRISSAAQEAFGLALAPRQRLLRGFAIQVVDRQLGLEALA